jgi:hypothetical protein
MQSGDEEATQSPVMLSVALACGLLALVFGLNLLDGPEIPVEYEQFKRFVKDEMVQSIVVGADGIRCQLREPVKTTHDGNEVTADRIFLPGSQHIPPEQVSYWESLGIAVEFDDEPRPRSWGGIAVVGILLTLGLWHVASQIYKDKKGVGAPRRRLQELEKEFRDGRISLEDYEKAREAIWAEM